MNDEPSIPIRNLFYLLVYAWDHKLDEAEERDFEAGRCPDLTHLFAKILLKGVTELLKTGLDRAYVPHEETTSRVRGRIDFSTSARHQTWLMGRLHCEFDEFSHDVLHNRLIKSTLLLFANDRNLNTKLRQKVVHCLESFQEVTPLSPVMPSDFRRVQLHRNNRSYRFLLSLCELVHASLLPDRLRQGKRRFRDFTRNEKLMARVFEDFVFHFAERHLKNTKVSAMEMKWQAEGPEESLAFLPVMRTDVTLVSGDRRVILDCKYYVDALVERHLDSGVKRFRSGHLYQLHAYLTNKAAADPEWANTEGILLYPVAGSRLDQSLVLNKRHSLRIVTLDFNQDWSCIHRDLLAILRGEQVGMGIGSDGALPVVASQRI